MTSSSRIQDRVAQIPLRCDAHILLIDGNSLDDLTLLGSGAQYMALTMRDGRISGARFHEEGRDEMKATTATVAMVTWSACLALAVPPDTPTSAGEEKPEPHRLFTNVHAFDGISTTRIQCAEPEMGCTRESELRADVLDSEAGCWAGGITQADEAMVMNAIIIVVALSLGGFLAFSRRLGKSSYWKAMVTPLASIMGSGFLVSAPLLGATVGNLAIVCMAVLLVLAYAVGGAIRFNIQHFEPIESGTGPAQDVAFLSRVVLVGAYFISVTYYLQLLAAFALKALGLNDQVASHLVTSSLLVSICGVGVWRGLGMLENLEKYTVALNLGMIGALLVALAAYNAQLLTEARWHLSAIPSRIDVHGARVLLGLLIIVQGFETSRYLGDEHSAAERISTMRAAQVVSSVIYLLFIGLAAVLFRQGMGADDVTGIIDMTRPVALVLPLLLSLAAIGSQFSASVADSEGAGGLIEDITHHRLRIRYAYLLIMLVTVAITWETNVNQIIAYASRAFALYYMWQCVVAFIVARRMKQLPHRRFRLATFALLSLVCLLVFALGVPSG